MLSLIGNIPCINSDFVIILQSRVNSLLANFTSPPMKYMSPKFREAGALILHCVCSVLFVLFTFCFNN